VLLIGCRPELRKKLQRACSSELFQFEETDIFNEQAPLNEMDEIDLVLLRRSAAGDTPHAIARIREKADIPLVVVADAYDEHDLVGALQAGAADYLYPPWTVREVLARVRAHIRRLHEYAGYKKTEHFELGVLTIDVSRHEVCKRGQRIELTPKEFDLLRMLATHAEKTVPREDLLREVWEVESDLSTRTLDVHVGRLRRKIEDNPKNPRIIITVPGVGYRFRSPDE
jgi:DNA-binding response OmpR family regulator